MVISVKSPQITTNTRLELTAERNSSSPVSSSVVTLSPGLAPCQLVASITLVLHHVLRPVGDPPMAGDPGLPTARHSESHRELPEQQLHQDQPTCHVLSGLVMSLQTTVDSDSPAGGR